jgi:cytochrome c oxidase subunit 2
MGVESISTFGDQIDSLYRLVFAFTVLAFILTEGALIYFLFRYRRRGAEKARYVHGNRRLEIVWTVIPGLLFFGLAIYQTGTWRLIRQELPPESESLVIFLEAEQFKWFPTYPGPDGRLGTADDIAAPENTVHVPVNQKVIIKLASRDVLHSFFVPVLRVKQDVIPGRTVALWFEATQTGVYEIACAELCGLGHYRMRAFLTVEEPAEFQTWLDEVAAR